MKKFAGMGIWKKTVFILLGIFLASILLCGVVFAFIYEHMQSTQRKEAVEKADEAARERIRLYMAEIDEVSYNVAYSSWLQKIFDMGITGNERYKRINEAVNFMNTLAFLNSDVQFSIFLLDGTRFNSNDWFRQDPRFHVEEQVWFEQLVENEKYVWSGKNQPVFYKNKEWCVMPFYVVNNYNTLDREAYLSVHISLETFRENVFGEQVSDNCYQSLLDTQNRPVFTEMPEQMQKSVDDILESAGAEPEETGRYTVKKSEVLIGDDTYYLLSVLENSHAAAVNGQIWFSFAGVIGLMAVILFVAALSISKYITKPLIKCRNAMKQIANNNLGLQIENPYSDEFGEMLESFNEMSSSISGLIEINRNISVMQKRAEYQLLERQINPHFLFNTLELINALIMEGRPEEARKVCETLGRLYHYNLRKDKYITLREEMEYTRQYLYLMTYKVRNLSFYCEMDPELEELKLIKVVLQPLAENAVRHGFQKENREYCVSLTAEKVGTDVRLTVMDNGEGMDEGTLQSLQRQVERICENPERPDEEAGHIGVKNVVQRMALEYGRGFQVSVLSKEGSGTRVELTIRGGSEDVQNMHCR